MKPLVPLLLSTFFYIFALSLLIPVFPTLISFAFPESASVTPESPEVTKLFGDLSLLKSCLDLLSLPVLGGLSDYLGRRPLHLFCLACAVLQVLLLLPPPLTSLSSGSYRAALYLSRALSGVSDAVLALLFASLTDLAGADASLLPVNYGKVGLVFGFSFTFGPLFSVLLFSQLGVSAVLAAALLSSLAALHTYAFFVPDTLPRSSRSPVPPKPHKHAGFLLSLTPLDQLRLLRKTPVVSSYLAVFVLHEWATGVYQSWILYFEWRYSWGVPLIGVFLSAVGITVGIFQGCLLKPLTRSLSSKLPSSFESALITYPNLAAVLNFVLCGLTPVGYLLFPFLLLTGLSSFTLPVLRGVALRTQPPASYGTVSALFSTAGVLARIASSALFPQLLRLSQERPELPAGLLNYAAAGLMLACFFLSREVVSRYDPNELAPAKGEADTGGKPLAEFGANVGGEML